MIVYAALTPHPPLIVPEIGADGIEQVTATIEAMQAVTAELAAAKPDLVVFLTPHGNVFADCFSILEEAELYGDFKNFGRADVKVRYANDLDFVHQLQKNSRENDLYLLGINREIAGKYRLNPELDHGIMVPLYYLQQTGLRTPLVAISIGLLSNIDLYRFGTLIQKTAHQLGRRVALIASGDMSHRLKEEGPYRFHPDGSVFDGQIRELIGQGNVEGILNIASGLRENAGECGYPSIVIMLGALDGHELQSRVFSYEGPFGVGYLVAGIIPTNERPSIMEQYLRQRAEEINNRRARESAPVRLARQTLESYLRHKNFPGLDDEMRVLLNQRAGVFVSLKKNGQLRGCIGTFLPAYENVVEEIKQNALAAGLRDPRFMPVKEEELDSLVYSVDILSPPEKCSREDLDPKKYGVIVAKGSRRGLLLPDLEGVDTVDQQLQIALQKAGISPHEQYEIQRFEVKRYQ